MKKRDIILFWVQGSGKWTQAKKLLESGLIKFEYFEPGKIYRAIKSNDNVIGTHVSQTMQEWKMIDEFITQKLFDIFFNFVDNDEVILIDWYLRNTSQMYYALHKLNLEWDRDFVAVYFDLPRDKAIERLLKRAKIEWRADDNIDSINQRLDIYYKETMPVIEYFEKLGKLIRIDADKTIDEVYNEMINKIL